MGSKRTIQASNVQIAYEGRFATPIIRLLTVESQLFDLLLARMTTHLAQLSDLKIETATSDLSQASVACNVYGVGGNVRVFADRLEIRTYTDAAHAQIVRLVTDAIAAINEADARLSLGTHSVAMVFHVSGISAGELSGKWLNPLSVAGAPPTASGIWYSFGSGEGRMSSSVKLEPSVIVPDGAFVQVSVTYDASEVSIEEAAQRAPEDLAMLYGAVLGKEVEGFPEIGP